jgi:flagellar FliJ protein
MKYCKINNGGALKRFEFKLQKLLEIRQKREDQEKIELSKASGAYQFVLNKKEKVLANIRTTLESLGKNKRRLNLKELQNYDRLVKDSDLAIRRLEVEIEKKRKIMQEHLDIYAALKRDRRAVEILREKALKKYDEDSNKEEQILIDETGQELFLRNKDNRRSSDN